MKYPHVIAISMRQAPRTGARTKNSAPRRVLAGLSALALTAGLASAAGIFASGTAWAEDDGVRYLDAKGAQHQMPCTALKAGTTNWVDKGCYYVATSGTLNIANRIAVNGNATLILADKTTLKAETGITLGEGSQLTIYAQSADADQGKLEATGKANQAGIGGNESKTGGTLIMNGGTVTATGGTGDDIHNKGGAGVGGGGCTEDSCDAGSGGTVNMFAGTLNAVGTDGGAGVGGGGCGDDDCHAGSGGTVNVFAGTLNAIGTYGAGVGGGYGDIGGQGGTVKVHNGTLTAYAKNSGAGIGGGDGESTGGNGGTFEIYGGTVNAFGGYNGAGIGGSYGADTGASGGTITIVDGTVNALGGYYAAGIGGGYGDETGGPGGTITIKGGTVNAIGGEAGAGIGGGNGETTGGSGGTITITGGTIIAAGNSYPAAGIGGGNGDEIGGPGGAISISGGTVVAAGACFDGSCGSGIGAGRGNVQNPGDPGTFSATGTALVMALIRGDNKFNMPIISDTSSRSSWRGIIYEGYTPDNLDKLPIVPNGAAGQWKFAHDFTTAAQHTVTIGGDNVALTIPKGATWTNHSKHVTVQQGGQLVAAGEVSADSENTAEESGGRVVPHVISSSLSVAKHTDTSITLQGAAPGNLYCKDDGKPGTGQDICQENGTFTGLKASTQYTFSEAKKPYQYYRSLPVNATTSASATPSSPKPVKEADMAPNLARTGSTASTAALMSLIALMLGGALLASSLVRRLR